MGQLLKDLEQRVMCAVGGVPQQEDVERLKKSPVIMVGTPNKIESLVRTKRVSL